MGLLFSASPPASSPTEVRGVGRCPAFAHTDETDQGRGNAEQSPDLLVGQSLAGHLPDTVGVLDRQPDLALASHILGWKNGLEMIRIYARPVSAEIIQLKALGDRPSSLFIHPSMSVDLRFGRVETLDAVPIPLDGELPDPATTIWIRDPVRSAPPILVALDEATRSPLDETQRTVGSIRYRRRAATAALTETFCCMRVGIVHGLTFRGHTPGMLGWQSLALSAVA